MKNLNIIIGTTILGLIIFNMMTGNEPGTLQSATENNMRNLLELYGGLV